jgi:hypothetical protein
MDISNTGFSPAASRRQTPEFHGPDLHGEVYLEAFSLCQTGAPQIRADRVDQLLYFIPLTT